MAHTNKKLRLSVCVELTEGGRARRPVISKAPGDGLGEKCMKDNTFFSAILNYGGK